MSESPARIGTFRARATTLEAIALLAFARLLIACVPFARWRGLLGQPVAVPPLQRGAAADANRSARYLARSVERAVMRLPGGGACLPQAMTLQWLLRRRGLGGTVVIGVRGGSERGGLDDLHAWLVRNGESLLGETDERHTAVYAATFAPETGSS